MKRLLISCSILSVLGALAFSEERVPDAENVRALMRKKLSQTQSVLEGIALEDFDLIAKNAGALSATSQAAAWQVVATPEYTRQSAEFRRTCDDLAEQAKKKNLDAAALSYVKLTMQCVECHKYVRSVRLSAVTPAEFERVASTH